MQDRCLTNGGSGRLTYGFEFEPRARPFREASSQPGAEGEGLIRRPRRAKNPACQLGPDALDHAAPPHSYATHQQVEEPPVPPQEVRKVPTIGTSDAQDRLES